MITIYIGKNGCGKTKKLKELNKKRIPNSIFIPTREIIYSSNDIKNSEYRHIAWIIFSLIKNIEKEILEQVILKVKEKLNKFDNDFYPIFKNLNLHDKDIEGENLFNLLSKEVDLLLDDFTSDEKRIPSGILNSNLIELVNVITYAVKKYNRNNYKQTYFFLDMPENYLHPNLIKKVANNLTELSVRSNVYLTTHSPLLINEFIKINYENSTAKQIVNIYQIKYLRFLDNQKAIPVPFLEDTILKGIVDLSDLTNCLFTDYVILVEGVRDFYITKKIMKSFFPYIDYQIVKANGVQNVTSLYHKLDAKNSFLNNKVFAFYDQVNNLVLEEFPEKAIKDFNLKNQYFLPVDLETALEIDRKKSNLDFIFNKHEWNLIKENKYILEYIKNLKKFFSLA